MHIAVVGLGPAGALISYRAIQRGWQVDGYDPSCSTVSGPLPEWKNTYGVALNSLPHWARTLLPRVSPLDSSDSPKALVAHTPGPHQLPYGPYTVVNSPYVLRQINETLTASSNFTAHRRRVKVLSTKELGVDAIVDCRGVIDKQGSIRQVAVGVFVPDDCAVAAGLSIPEFMDWRLISTDGVPSFLYVVPTESGVLIEETVLATRLPTRELLPVLEDRLRLRVGELVDRGHTREIVHFPMDQRRRPWYRGKDARGVLSFGAAGGLTHPATGYSVAASAAAVDHALDLVESDAPGSWPTAAEVSAASAWWLRRLGAELIVSAESPEVLPQFFDAFFRLSPALQRGYLDGHRGGMVAAAMMCLAVWPTKVLPFLRPLPRVLARAVVTAVTRVIKR